MICEITENKRMNCTQAKQIVQQDKMFFFSLNSAQN